MCKRLNLEITETVEYLKQAYKQECDHRSKERLHMLYLYKSGEATERERLIRILGRSGPTLTTWINKYRTGGLESLLERKPGGHRALAIHPAAMKELQEKLDSPTGFAGYKQIQQWLKDEWGLVIPYMTVFNNVKYRLKADLKTVRPASVKQDVQSMEAFKKNSTECLRP